MNKALIQGKSLSADRSGLPAGRQEKIKICFVASVDITLKFLLLSNLKFLIMQGYDVYAVCSPGKWVESIKKEGVKVKTIKIKRKAFSPFSDLISLFRLFFYFKKENFGAVFTFTPKPGLLGQLAAKAAGAPIILNTIFGFYFHEGTPYFKRRFFIFIEKIAAKCSDFVFFRNKEDFETAKKEKIIRNSMAEHIGDGIDILHFNPKRFTSDFIKEKKEKMGIDPKKTIIGIVARLVSEKGYIELFGAFESVVIKFPDSLLLAVGSADPSKKDNINLNIVRNFGIEKNILFLGERTDVDEIYSLMDIFVLPSYREGFSHSIMEAMAMARPVIATDIRGCRGAVEPNITGLLVPPKNYKKLAEAIIYLILNPDKAKLMGESGRKKAEKEFDERLFFGRMEKELKELIKRRIK
ncbi:MAG: glycosyltransferase family 4 protein [Candidatus Staskawiczbacteria bacterium]|nr:glycosyltransferase family 4 protein [Candidatus Staskawiczbacteria bacterium]MBI3337217.1 glycosyltransferase family 4 protein [Candidatus Staskawiczbacteria bacterium]